MSGRRRRRVAERKDPILNPPPPTRPFWREAVHAFVYPLVPGGLVVIMAAALLLTLWFTGGLRRDDLGRSDWLMLGHVIVLGIIAITFVTYVFFDVIQSSAGGLRRFPKVFLSDEFDWVESLIYGIEGVVISYLPTISALLLTAGEAEGWVLVLLAGLLALGCLYLPMALLSLAVWRDPAAVSPPVVLPLLKRVPVPTVLAAVLLWLSIGLHVMVIRAAFADASFSLVFFGNLAAVYLYFVVARIIGITHWVCRNEIGWFPERDSAPEEE